MAFRFDLCCILFSFSVAAAPDSLRQINVLYRHGDRSPVSSYPTDPISPSYWPQGLGWLTETGMRQQYELGQYLRSEYGNFLNSTYKNTEIVVQASNVNRCLMSAYCNLAGLYPPGPDQQWNPNLLWQPIPVHTRPEAEDNKLALEKPCARYDELYAKELHSPVVQQEEKENAAFYQLLDEKTGVKRENISVVWQVIDTLFVEYTHNLTLPDWTQQPWQGGTVFSKLMELRHFGFSLLYNGTQLSRLKGGPLLKEVIQNMQNAASRQDGQYLKMHMYSAHDSTVSAFLDAMNVYNMLAPPYASAVLVELHNINNAFCVKILYHNETSNPPYPLVHPGCDQQECCPLDTFVAATKDRVPVDWEAECKNPNSNPEDDDDDDLLTGTGLALLVGCTVLFVLLLLLTVGFLRQRRVVKTFECV